MSTKYQADVTFEGNVTVSGTFTAAGVPTLQGLTLLVNGNAAAGTDEDPAIALLGGDGGSELIRTTIGQDSSADKAFVKMQGGAAGATEKSMTLHVGAIATVASVNSTLVLEAGASAANKPASLVNTGSTGVLAIAATTGVTIDAATSLAVGNASTNPTFSQLGTGQVSFAGNVNAPAGVDVNADSQALTVGASADLSISHNGTDTLVVNTTGHLRIDNQATTGKIQVDLGTNDGNTAFEVRNNSGSVVASITAAGVSTGFGSTVYMQSAEYASVLARGSSNTNILYASVTRTAAGSGCFTATTSAANGTYIQATRNCWVTVSLSLNRASGTAWIKTAAALSNTLNAGDTDSRGAKDYAVANESLSHTFYLASGNYAWTAMSADPGAQAEINKLSFVAMAV